MQQSRWDRGFTIVEMLIVVVVIAILASITAAGWSGIRMTALKTAAQSDLKSAASAMQLSFAESGTYPSAIPAIFRPSDNVNVTVKWSGKFYTYTSLTAVQNGVLLADICQKLIDEGVGKGTSQNGEEQDYIMGCGNWNYNSTQITAWDSRVWKTPVLSDQLIDYANTFTTKDTWNANQVTVVKNFYTQLVQRHLNQGGVFPVTSFWDAWATSSNGGVIKQALPEPSQIKTTFCLEAQIVESPDTIWHITEDGTVKEGGC